MKKYEGIIGWLMMLPVFFVIFIIAWIVIDILIKGIGVISFQFLFMAPRDGMTKGGIFPCIVGTFYVTMITALFSIPFGVFAAIYLNEYAKDTNLNRFIRLAIRNLSGVPSIVFGLFGLGFFIQFVGEDKLQHGVTEKFQALVVRGPSLRFVPARRRRAGFVCDRRMRQRQPQQALVAEHAAKPGLEFGKFGHGLLWEHPTPNIQH